VGCPVVNGSGLTNGTPEIETRRCGETEMKRIVVLIDGTWNQEGTGADTNVAKLDGASKSAGQAFIKAAAADGIAQHIHYHDGVGVEGNLLNKLLGGAIGLGLKKIIQEAYETIVADFVAGDEIYIFGFSRGAYAARALAGLIGASGIQRVNNPDGFEVAWQHYRVAPSARAQPHDHHCRRVAFRISAAGCLSIGEQWSGGVLPRRRA
jgi:uncharacterized protein (DUF2235 family)